MECVEINSTYGMRSLYVFNVDFMSLAAVISYVSRTNNI